MWTDCAVFEVTRLVHVDDPGDPSVVPTLIDRVEGAIDRHAVESALIAPTLPGVRNGGDVLMQLRFADAGRWRGMSDRVDGAIGEAGVRHVDGAESGTVIDGGNRAPAADSTVHRTLLLRVDDVATEAQVRRFEEELLRMPRYVSSMTSWQLRRVDVAIGASAWTHVWEQTFTDLDGLLGQYMAHPVHWGYVDRWFDPESPDHIVRERVCHSFCLA